MSKDYLTEFDRLLKECDSIYHNYAVCLGMSDCSLWILDYVSNAQGDVRQADICERIFVSRQTVNSALKKLEQSGCLTLSKIDGKQGKSIHLTPRGKAFAEKYLSPLAAAEERTVKAFSDDEMQTFLATMRRIVTRLDAEIGKEQEALSDV